MRTTKILAAACAAVTMLGSVLALPQETFSSIMNTTSASAVDTSLGRVVMKENYTCTTNAVRINWNKVDNATGYRIFRYDTINKKWVRIATVIGATTYRDDRISSGTTFAYRVRAYSVKDGVTTEGKSSATFRASTKPFQVNFTTFSRTKSSIRLNWKRVRCTGYKVYQLKDNKWYEIGSTTGDVTTLKVNGLTAGTGYSFMITAYTEDPSGKKNFSAYSKSIDILTKSAPVSTETESVTIPSEFTGKVGEAIVVKADKNVGGFRVKNVVLSSESENVKYSFTYSGDSVTFKFNSADTAKFKIVLYSTKGTRVVCTTTITAEK